MKLVLCTGGRDYADHESVSRTLESLDPDGILVGDAPGADKLVREWACYRGKHLRVFYALWSIHGKSAGPRRNEDMVVSAVRLAAVGNSVQVVAFPGGRGTQDCVRRARKVGLEVLEVPRHRAL